MGIVFLGAAGLAFVGGRRYHWLNYVGLIILAVFGAAILLSLSAGASTSSQ